MRGRVALGALTLAAALAPLAAATPTAHAESETFAPRCRAFAEVKATLHTMATNRVGELGRLVATLEPRPDPFGLNGPEASTLQQASQGVMTLDEKVQATCYTSAAALHADAVRLFDGYRVYWLRVPQTHVIEAADDLAQANTALTNVATRLAPLVGANATAKRALDAMNASLATAVARLGIAPTAAASITTVAQLSPAPDMTANVTAVNAARADLTAAATALGEARVQGIAAVNALRR